MNVDDIELIETFPDARTYRALRAVTGMLSKTHEAVERGLKNTLYGVSLRHAGDTIGMGREMARRRAMERDEVRARA